MLAHMQDALAGDLPPELAPDDDMEYLERSVAIIAALAAFVASDLAAESAPDSGAGPAMRHDVNRTISRASDKARANQLNPFSLARLMENLAGEYRADRSWDSSPNVVFQVEINEDAARAEDAKSITTLNAPQMNFLEQQAHATFFIRHRVLSPWRTEWTDWELSGGGNVNLEHFNRSLKVEGVDHWIDFQRVNPTE